MSLKTLINSIGHFFAGLFKSTQKAYNELPEDQQQAILNGVNIAEIIKQGYKEGEEYLVAVIAAKAGISTDIARGVLDHVLKSWGINETSVQAGLDKLAEAIDNGLTNDGWNGLWETVAKSAASLLGTGRVNWVTLGLGVTEFAYQKFIKGVK